MFRILSIIIIIASLLWLYRFWNSNNISLSNAANKYFTNLKDSFGNIKKYKTQSFSSKLDSFKMFFYFSTFFLFALMFLSAFIPAVLFGDNLSDLFLLVHVSVAPFFSIFLAVLIILFAHSNRFNKNDFANETKAFKFNQTGYIKITFWLIVLFTIPAMIAIVLNMFPLFGTEGQLLLLEIHRYSTLIIFMLVIFHSGLITVNSTLSFK
ncbi:MAG: hypothetical protein GY936_16285 [Ignavibacteriae bacterium]|nr:hypothetical protein [Ignavibacteriota bacterium]